MALFGAYLRHHRTRIGLSLRRLAEVLGVDPSILSRLERGEISNPSDELLLRLPEALGRPRSEVFLAAQRITPELAERLERGMPVLVEQVAKILSDTEEHLSGATQLPALPISELLTTTDEATMHRLIDAGNDLSEILVALFSDRITQEQFEHVAAVIQHVKRLVLPSPPKEGTP